MLGSVASRSGPREVATACTSTLPVVGAGSVDTGAAVAGMDSTAGGAAGTLVAAEAQADANSTATRLTVQKKKRGLIGFLLFIMINDSLLPKLLTKSHQILRLKAHLTQNFDEREILRYTNVK